MTSPPTGGLLTAVVADELSLLRRGVASVLADHDLHVVGETGSGREALRLVVHHAPTLVVVGRLFDLGAVEFVRRLRRDVAGNPPITVGLLPGPTEDVGKLVRIGIDGLALRSASADEIGRTIVRALAGDRPVAAGLLPGVAGPGAVVSDEVSSLSGREREVLSQLASGLSNRKIATELFVTEATVKSHLSRIYSKLGVTSRTEALGRAATLGLLG